MSFSVDSAMGPIMVNMLRHLNVRIGEYISISPLIKKQVKPKNSPVADHLLFCNHSASYDNFSILTCENKKFLTRIKDSLLIMRYKPSLNRNLHRHHPSRQLHVQS